VKASDGIPGTEDIIGKNPFGLLIFEPRMQEIYKSWLRQILTTKSPYSGRTLAEEPSVGLFEIQNEDSLFFWTFQPAALGAGPRQLLEKQFGTWLARKYGSINQAFAAWPADKIPDDSVPDARAGLYGAYEMSSAGFPKQSPDRQKRILDQVHFLAQLQHDFYAGMRKFLREDLGAKWPVSASNWTTAPGLGFIERYTYSGVDVIDKHGYFGGKHEGDGAGWSARPIRIRPPCMIPPQFPFSTSAFPAILISRLKSPGTNQTVTLPKGSRSSVRTPRSRERTASTSLPPAVAIGKTTAAEIGPI
jgi:hypothetical protein